MRPKVEYTIRERVEYHCEGLVSRGLLDETALLRMSVDRARNPLSIESMRLLKMVGCRQKIPVDQIQNDSAAELVDKKLAVWISSSLEIMWYGLAYLASAEGLV